MKVLLIRFEKEVFHYVVIEDLLNIGMKDMNIQKTAIDFAGGVGESYQKLLEELLAKIGEHKADLLIFHAGSKYMGKIDEVRYAHECFLQYFCAIKNITILGLNKISCRKMLDMKQKDFGVLLDEKKAYLNDTYKVAKSNKILEGLALLLLVKNAL